MRMTPAVATAAVLMTVTLTAQALTPGPTTPTPDGVPDCLAADGCDGVVIVDEHARFHYAQRLEDVTNAESLTFGNPGDAPLFGDWDCDGMPTPGMYRPTDGFVYLRNSNTSGIADLAFFYGDAADVPLVGDFNGDGCDTVSIYRPAKGRIYVKNSLRTGIADYSFLFGDPGDKPFVGDFDGDGIDTVGLHRESTGFLYFRDTNTQGAADQAFYYGDPGDQIIAGDWDGDGDDTVAVYRPADQKIYVKNANEAGSAEFEVTAREATTVLAAPTPCADKGNGKGQGKCGKPKPKDTTTTTTAATSTTSVSTTTMPATTTTTSTSPTTTTVPPTTTTTVPPTTTTTVPPTTSTTTTTLPPVDDQPEAPIRAAFYYPWFPNAWDQGSPDPFTHYTPSAGLYDSSDPALIDQHLAWAADADLEAFIASWWGQGHHTDAALGALLDRSPASPNPSLRFAVYYEEEGQSDPAPATIEADLDYLAVNYFADPAYLRIDGQPVIFVWADPGDGAGMAQRWADAEAAFGGGLHVVLKVFPGYRSDPNQPDSWHQYGPADNYDEQLPHSATVSPGFWHAAEATPRLARDVDRFAADVARMDASGAFWQLVTAWNEWGEGTSVEPAEEWGSAYLDVLAGQPPPPTATTTTTTTTTTTIPSPGGEVVLVAAGDIACDPASGSFNGGAGTSTRCHQQGTADLITAIGPDIVATLGDNQYEDGTAAAFAQSYDPSWGAHRAITRPSVGNHEYRTPGAAGYYDYFGAAAGDPAKGYYAYDAGDWHVVVLNSNCSDVSCSAGSAQAAWLAAELAANPTACTLAYMHHPRFSSGSHGDYGGVADLYEILYAQGVDVLLTGHDHNYERLARLDPDGNRDPAGPRNFVVGSGGKSLRRDTVNPRSITDSWNDDTFGVLKLTLRASGYDWEFVPENGTFTDTGSSTCS